MFEKKSVVVIPVDKCPLDVIAEMGEEAKKYGIFLSNSAMKKLIGTVSKIEICDGDVSLTLSETKEDLEPKLMEIRDGEVILTWPETEAYPRTKLITKKSGFEDWNLVIRIEADDICFKKIPADPEALVFLTMESK